MKTQAINFRALKILRRPVKIEFTTKDGQNIYFKGVQAYEIEDPMKMETPELIKFLRKNGLKSLAKALQKLSKRRKKETKS